MRMIILAFVALFTTSAMADGHLITKESANDVKTTADRIELFIANAQANGAPARVFARINHGLAAVSVGQELQPTEVVIFGNPKGGTPLMLEQRTIAVDLPLRVLVTEIDGKVIIAYHDPVKLGEFHGIKEGAKITKGVAGLLAKITDFAAAK